LFFTVKNISLNNEVIEVSERGEFVTEDERPHAYGNGVKINERSIFDSHLVYKYIYAIQFNYCMKDLF